MFNYENYLRFGNSHLFLNFTERNLEDLATINAKYGKGMRTKKITHTRQEGDKIEYKAEYRTVYSGKIHIFISFVNLSNKGLTTFELLQRVKTMYGAVFKIYVHFFGDTTANIVLRKNEFGLPIENCYCLSSWTKQYIIQFRKLIKADGKMEFICHDEYDPVTFSMHSTVVRIQNGPEGFEIVTPIMVNTKETFVELYDPLKLDEIIFRRNYSQLSRQK